MNFESILFPLKKAIFFNEFWERKGAHIRGTRQKFRGLFDWEKVSRSLRMRANPIRASRDGVQTDLKNHNELMNAYRAGKTIVIDSAELSHPDMAEMVSEISKEFGAEVTINIYCTPPGKQGFGIHFDSQDVFLLQTNGSKRWKVYENVEHPFPLEGSDLEKLNQKLALKNGKIASPAETREPYLDCLLEEGDVLYIPRGHWHSGSAEKESMHLTLTIVMMKAVDLLSGLAQRLRESEDFRRNIPVVSFSNLSGDGNQRNLLDHFLKGVREKLIRIMTDDMLFGIWAEQSSRGYLATQVLLPVIQEIPEVFPESASYFRNKFQRPIIQQVEEGGIVLYCAEARIWFNQKVSGLIYTLVMETHYSGLELRQKHPDLTWAEISHVIGRLMHHNLLWISTESEE